MKKLKSNYSNILFLIFGFVCFFETSCSSLFCVVTGDTCKKVKFIDFAGVSIVGASAGGNPLSPSVMNSSNEHGYLVLSKYWANPKTGLVTIKAHGFLEFTQGFDDIEKVVVMKSIND